MELTYQASMCGNEKKIQRSNAFKNPFDEF